MIVPSKHVRTDRSLLFIAARAYSLTTKPKTVSELWREFNEQKRPSSRGEGFDWFIMALDLLHLMGLVDYSSGLISRTAP